MNGDLYFQDSKLTDISFLNFFFQRIEYNTTGIYPQYLYISICGKEVNFIECKDTPIVFRKLESNDFVYGGDLKVLFDYTNLVYVQDQSTLFYKFFNKKDQELYGRIGKNPLVELANRITQKGEIYFFDQFRIPEVASFEELIKDQHKKMKIF